MFVLVASDERACYGGEGEVEANGEEDEQDKDTVDETGGGEFHRGVVAYHEGVGEVEDKIAYLADDYRGAELD